MQPRLKSSKKWTSFPKEYTDQIKAVFEENFEPNLDDEKVEVEGRIYTGEVLLRVGLIKPGRLRQANFEASMDYSTKSKDALERIHNTVDAVASMIADYFENEEEADLPLAWKEFPFQGKSVFLQYSTLNADLEKQADALLGELADDLVVDKEEAVEDALAFAEVDPSLTAEDEEFPEEVDEDDETHLDQAESADDKSENKGPKMFSGTKTKTRKKTH
jgi:hypothetical protein